MDKSIVINTYKDEDTGQTRTFPRFVKKGWGYETWLVNNELYCGKILNFKKGASFSTHFHIDKDESFYILKGKIEFHYFNLDNAERIINILDVGKSIRIPPHVPHKIVALEATQIIEISTTHRDEDSYRIEKGDTQKQIIKP